jgi:hypothetical protein
MHPPVRLAHVPRVRTLLSRSLIGLSRSLGEHPSPSQTSSCPSPLGFEFSSDTRRFSRLGPPPPPPTPSSFFTFFFFGAAAPPPTDTGSPSRAAVAAFFLDAIADAQMRTPRCASQERRNAVAVGGYASGVAPGAMRPRVWDRRRALRRVAGGAEARRLQAEESGQHASADAAK